MTLRSPIAKFAAGFVTALGVAIGMTVAAVTSSAPAVSGAPAPAGGAATTVRANMAQGDDDVVPEGGTAPATAPRPAAPPPPAPAGPPPPPAPAGPAPGIAAPPAGPVVDAVPPPAADSGLPPAPPPVDAAPPPAGPAPGIAAPPDVSAPANASASGNPPPPKPQAAPSKPKAAPSQAVGALPTVQSGDSTVMVATLQHLLRYHGAHIEADAEFGAETEAAVRDFQQLFGLPVDGVVRPETWTALFVTVQRGDANEAVSAVQHRLGYDGFLEGNVEWGTFDAPTDAAVRAYQQANGLPVDGVVGPATWAKLVGHV
jgi:peptidoglycan hydrolase-like protein with peptidoglycan-binding domain